MPLQDCFASIVLQPLQQVHQYTGARLHHSSQRMVRCRLDRKPGRCALVETITNGAETDVS